MEQKNGIISLVEKEQEDTRNPNRENLKRKSIYVKMQLKEIC